MGVRGLTTFIAKNSKCYLKPTILRDTFVVVDGNCVASHLFKWCTRRDSAFGGDYEEYYVIVKKFFMTLKKCNIVPIVVMDGGYEYRKIPTVLQRLKTKLFTLKTSFGSYSRTKFFPLFMKIVFCEAGESCNVTLIQTEFEADREIACIARQLACPVISYDSDFFIYDVLYIPFDTVHLELTTEEDLCGLSCSLYNVEDFLNVYSGLQKGHLPFLATALGNDFVESYVFHKFFHQIPLPKGKTSSNAERKILGLLNWLRHETEETAVTKMLLHISKKDHEAILRHLKAAKENYTATCNLQVTVENNRATVVFTESLLSVSSEMKKLLRQCKLPSFVIDMAMLDTYFTQLQIEDVKETSAHQEVLPLISAIYSLICSDHKEATELKLYIREKLHVKCQTISATPADSILSQLRQGPMSGRRKFIFDILSLNEKDLSLVQGVLDECQMFFSCFIAWSSSGKASAYHMHSLLFTYLGCQAQHKVGMFRSFDGEVSQRFVSLLSALRKTTDSARCNYSAAIVHVFNIFQSILYHTSILNVMLGLPIKPCKVTDSFSGTLAYNVYSDLVNRSEVLKYISSFLQPASTVAEMYTEFYDRLERFFPLTPKIPEADKKRRKRKKRKNEKCQVWPECLSDSDDQYEDINNKFSVLLQI